MKLREANHRNMRFAHHHVGAKRPIQHPLRNLDDLARSNFHPDNRATGPILTTFMTKMATVKWMPTIMKFHQLPDMGRMTLRWPAAEKPGCS